MSKHFPEYKGLNLVQTASDVLDYWQEHDIFKKSVEQKPKDKPFIFFEGPPSANGLPGIHHVMARAIKDIFCRYKTQKGYRVDRKAGWDTHGLPVELSVEKELGITKEDIGKKISVEEYNAACKKTVMRYTDVWNDLTQKMGYWVDMENPYITYTPKYMESVWWLLAQIYKKGWIYKGYTIQPYSPKAGTGLSSHELNQPGTYQDVTDTTVTAQFKAVKETLPDNLKQLEGDVFFLAWTTTPWTLPSNTALTVGKKIDYIAVKTFNQYTFEPITVILALPLLQKQFGKKYYEVKTIEELGAYEESQKNIPFYIMEEFKGETILESRYEQLFPFVQPYHNPENAFRVIAGDFVTTEDGTGIVHTAPTFGADDALVAKQATPEIPAMLVKDENDNLVPLVDLTGKFRPELGEYANKYVKNEYYDEGSAPEKSVDVELAIQLKIENRAFKVEKYVHSYPNCWRTDKPILYYPLDSWFIKATAVKDRMFELNKTINWKPTATGEGRFGNWLANANDWNLSRSRYWGIPLPIWRTEDGKEEMIVESIAQLKQEIEKSVEKGFMTENPFKDFVENDFSDKNYEAIDIHKNVVDKVVLVSESGHPMKRESDLIDVWFDSGSMPYSQWHYPFENKAEVENGLKTADFIAEGVDQTRGWFYTLHAIATMVFDDVAYKNVVSNGLVLDAKGQKMSKRLGNAVDPFKTIATYGPDAVRWYMISNANPWDNLKFDLKGIEEVQRKFFGTLYNTYSFFALYANIDKFEYKESDVPLEERPEIDRWILSELHTLINTVDKYFEEYEPTKAVRAISDFVQENLSNWYVRLSRRRFWKGDYQKDKISAYQTLYTCMLEISKLMAPVAPFFADRLYQDLVNIKAGNTSESVHLDDFSLYDESYVDKPLEDKMHIAQIISSLVLSLRKKEKIKVRQPLQRIMIPVLDEQFKADVLQVANLIKSEVNVKDIEFIDDTSDMLIKSIKPNFKLLGPKYGKEVRFVVQAINGMDKVQISTLEKDGSIALSINGEDKIITLDEVEITSQDIEGWLVATQNNITVALDIHIDSKLKNEGIARELVNRIQNLRKDSNLNVTDHISIDIEENTILQEAIDENLTYIKRETLTESINFANRLKNGREIEFDDVKTVITLKKV
jgi:isoleucyl-tRNA synthetase